MAVRNRVKVASQIINRLAGYPDIGAGAACDGQVRLLNVACETLSRYMLGEIDDDQDMDGLDWQCLEIASKIRSSPEYSELVAGDRFQVRHKLLAAEDGSPYYAVWLETQPADAEDIG
jgi:hypothetical protein